MEASLNPAQFVTYIDDFPRFEATEAAGWEVPITEGEISDALKLVGFD